MPSRNWPNDRSEGESWARGALGGVRRTLIIKRTNQAKLPVKDRGRSNNIADILVKETSGIDVRFFGNADVLELPTLVRTPHRSRRREVNTDWPRMSIRSFSMARSWPAAAEERTLA